MVYSVLLRRPLRPAALVSVFAALAVRATPVTEGRNVSQDPFLNSCTVTITHLLGNAIPIAILLGVTLFGITVLSKIGAKILSLSHYLYHMTVC